MCGGVRNNQFKLILSVFSNFDFQKQLYNNTTNPTKTFRVMETEKEKMKIKYIIRPPTNNPEHNIIIR